MPKLGDILFYKEFEFDDGSKSDKLFIVICSNEYCLVLKTTKNDKFYKNVNEGCSPQKQVFFIPKEKKEFFYLDTYVQLPQLIEIPIKKLQGSFSQKIKNYEFALSEKCMQSILSCLKNFKGDIAPEHWDLIFSNTKDTPSNNSLQNLASKFNKRK